MDLVLIFGSVIIVSLVALVGIFFVSINLEMLRKSLLYLVSFAAGAMFGDAFIHLLPEAAEESGFTLEVSLYALAGIMVFFSIEKLLKWHHCHNVEGVCEYKAFGAMNLIGDAVHNFIDGLIIAASYIASVPLGIASTLAVVFHEIPQEIGDYAVLIHSGYSKKKALGFNFLSALASVLGAAVVVFLSGTVEGMNSFLIPFSAGSFIYIAGSDLIPELHETHHLKVSIGQLLSIIAGVVVMVLLLNMG